MYISKVVTVSSTAIIATITASPLQVLGPSDTPIFSIVNPPFTSAPAAPTAAFRPTSMIPLTTLTVTAAVTRKIQADCPPYPAFNASNYPRRNSTEHHDHHHHKKNSTNTVPVMYSNCTNAVPVLYTSGNRTFSTRLQPHDPKDSRVEIICEDRNRKNETKDTHGEGKDSNHSINTMSFEYKGTSLSVASGAPNVPHIGAGGAVYESQPPVEGERDETYNSAGQGSSGDVKTKRETGDVQTNKDVPAYVKALEKGPII